MAWLRKARWAHLVLTSAAYSIWFRRARRRIPFAELVGSYLVETPQIARPRRFPQPGTLSRAVNLATSVWPLRTTCLIRSLVLAKQMRKYGYQAVVVLGVVDKASRQDWLAHAWVEAGVGAGIKERLRLIALDEAHTS